MLDRDKLLVRRSAIQRRVRPRAAGEELTLGELGRDAAGRSQHGEHPWLSLRGSMGVCSPFA